MRKLKRILTAVGVGVFFVEMLFFAVLFVISALRCVDNIIQGVQPTTTEYIGLIVMSLIAGISGAIWYFDETENR